MALKDKLVNLEDLKVVGGAVDDLKTASGELESRLVNDGSIFNMIDTIYAGGYVENDGGITPYNNYSYTDYIEIDPTKSYTFVALGNTNYEYYTTYSAYYDANKDFLGYINGQAIQNRTFTGAKYVRLSWQSSKDRKPLFALSSVSNPYIGAAEKIPPYKLTPADFVDLSGNSTLKTSWLRNSPLFTGTAVRSINRIGNIGGAPENSLKGFINAINAGFDILLVDLLWTSNGVPVCCHDNDISRVAKTMNGDAVSGVLISDTTYSNLYNNYDFGIVKGTEYKGLHILQFADFLRFIKYMGVKAYVEFKDFSSGNYSLVDTVNMAYQYGVGDLISWHGGEDACRIIHNNYPNASLAYYIGEGAASDTVIQKAISFKNENEVFLFGWNTTTFTSTQIATLIENGIAFECGTLNSESDIISYITNNVYCRGIESDSVVAYNVLVKHYISY